MSQNLGKKSELRDVVAKTETSEPKEAKLNAMSLKDLRRYAKEHGIQLGKTAANKAGVIQKLLNTPEAKKVKKVGKGVKVGQKVASKHGHGVQEYWAKLFINNEKLYDEGKMSEILTNEEITKAMHMEFPQKHSAIFKDVSLVRGRFNRHAVTMGNYNPNKVVSYRYQRDNKNRVFRSTARGTGIKAVKESKKA